MDENMDVTQIKSMLLDMLSGEEKKKFLKLSADEQDEFIRNNISAGGVAGMLISIKKQIMSFKTQNTSRTFRRKLCFTRVL